MKNKIAIIISLCLVVLLAGSVILLASLKKDYKPEFSFRPVDIKITNTENGKEYFNYDSENNPNKEEYDKFVEALEKSMEQSLLSSILNQNNKNEIKIIPKTSLPTINGYKVEFDYKTNIVLKNNGEEYAPKVEFSKIVFEINEEDGYKTFNIYVIENASKERYYQVSTIADTYEVFKLVEGFEFK